MHPSIYNNYVVEDNRVVVYNTITGSAIACEAKTRKEVEEWLKRDGSDDLISLGFVTQNNLAEQLAEMRSYYQRLREAKESMVVSMIMTYECNCACSYCFEELGLKKAIPEDLPVDNVVQYIIDKYRADSARELTLYFFGGEPTLKVDAIQETMRSLKRADINVKPLVITNGVALTRKVAEDLLGVGVSNFQITIDGNKEMHDIRRPMKSGKSGYNAIMYNLQDIADLPVGVTIRINVDAQNVSMIETIYYELPEAIRNNPNTQIYIAPVVGCKLGSMKHTLETRTDNLRQVWNVIKNKGLNIYVDPPRYAPCPQMSASSAFYIDLEGKVYTCGGFVGKEEKIERVFDLINDNHISRVNRQPKDRCFECSLFPICMGGCRFEESELGGYCQKSYLKSMHDTFYSTFVS